MSRPSLPVASPHQVGHYFGLHPEDQPYQSRMVTAQRSVEPEPWPMPEPERIILPMVNTPAQPVDAQPASFPARAVHPKNGGQQRVVVLPGHAISALLTISCLFFLLGSSILAFVLMGKHTSVASAAIWVNPGMVRTNGSFVLSGRGFGGDSLMTFTYDTNRMFFNESGYPLETHTNIQGNFTLQLHIPAQWQVGTHFIHVTDEAEKLSVSTRITVLHSSVTPP